MLEQNKSWNYRSKREKFDTFLLCYFIIILTLSIFFWKKGPGIGLLLVLWWILFVILLMIERFLIIRTASNRIIRKLNNYSHKYWLKSDFSNSIIVQYNPPKWINAAEAWLLLHCYASTIDMFSLLYLWSSKKYISIECEERKDWKELIILKKLKDLPDDTPVYQSVFFYKLFFWSLDIRCLSEISEINNCFDLSNLEKYGISKWWFKSNSLSWYYLLSWKKVLPIYVIAFIVWCLFSFRFAIWLVAILCILKPLLKHFYKLKRTEEWDKLAEHLLWFRKFVLSCDEKKFESFLREDPLYYDEMLSYAVVFWIETDLMKKLIPVFDEDIDPGDWTYWRWSKIGSFKK